MGFALGGEPDYRQMVRDETLAEMALEVRLASVFMFFDHGGDNQCRNPGIFISPDGLALFSLPPIAHHTAPRTVEVAGGRKIGPGELLEVFPEEGVVLFKFDHEPEGWTSVADENPELGQVVALVPPERHCERCAMIWPVLAPVNSVWQRTTDELREPVFGKLFNVVSGMSDAQEKGFKNGTGHAVVNERGELLGICMAIFDEQNLKRIESCSLAGLGAEIRKAVQDPVPRKLPYPKDRCPLDPALADNDYKAWLRAESDGRLDEARQNKDKLLEAYPDSRLILSRLLYSDAYEEGDVTEEDLPVVREGDSPALRQAKELIRAQFASRVLGGEGEIEALERAIEASPRDVIGPRLLLAECYVDAGEWEKAEKLCRDIYKQSWGSIQFVELFERVLTNLRKWDEVDACADRIIELGEMGRQQRGGGERELRERYDTLRRIHGRDDPKAVEAGEQLEAFLKVKTSMEGDR